MTKKKIYIGSDHAGFELKNKLISWLESEGYVIADMGPYIYNDKDDYPDFISLVAREVSESQDASFGVIMGGSGQGEAVVANRFPNVRAAVYYGGNLDIVKLSREHNDANVLSFGARFVNDKEAKEALALWLETPFSGDERHMRRIRKIDELKKYDNSCDNR